MVLKVHPTAIIDRNAEIDDNVGIGAYAIIGPHVKIGSGTKIGNHANITGHTTIGQNNNIFNSASIGQVPQDKKYKDEPTRLEIGDNNTIREFCTLNIGTVQGTGVTKIGNNNWIMACSHIAHDCIIHNNTIFANNVALAGHVEVKDWAILGGSVVIHQFCTIAEHVFIGGFSSVSQDIPPYVMAVGYRAEPKGINLEGLKRRGFTAEQIENVKHAYKILYRQGLSYAEARDQISKLAATQPELAPFINLFTQSTRGIIR